MEFFNTVVEFFNDIIEFIKFIVEFMTNGIYEFFYDAAKELTAYFVIGYFEFKIWAMQFSWDVAKTIMQNLRIGDQINNALSGLDSTVISYLNFFRVFEGLNLIIQAYITRFTMYVMGWL